ncbi:hypothetical protein D1007_36447 [Hordeum vulgare]|nr:hypothetical protein D1007_36447 [Hordeum vulgare]
MPNPGQTHMDVESNIRAEASSYQWNTGKPKNLVENQDGDADNVNDLDMLDFVAMIADFKGRQKDMVGYKDIPTIDAVSKKYLYPGCKKKYSKLSATLAFLGFRAANGLSNKGFRELFGILKEIIPEDNLLPKSTKKAKKNCLPIGT